MHNRQLFPSHKALFKAVERCKEIPENFIDLSQNLLLNINLEEMVIYYEKVIFYFKEYDYSDIERIGIILENEWT